MKRGGLIYLFVLISLLAFSPLLAQTKVDSLQKVLLTQKEDSNKVNTLNELANLFRTTNYSKNYTYASEAYILSKKIFYLKGQSRSLFLIGECKRRDNKFDEAIIYFEQSISCAKKINHELYQSYAYTSIGVIYGDRGNYSHAIDYYFIALKFAERSNNPKLLTTIYNNIATVYSSQNNYENGLKYFLLALKIAIEIDFQTQIIICYNNIGYVYDKMGQNTNAIKYYKLGVDLSVKTDSNPNELVPLYSNIGDIYFKQKDYLNAEKYYLSSLNLVSSSLNIPAQGYCYIGLAKLYAYKNNFDSAQKYLNLSIYIARKKGVKEIVKEAYFYYAKLDSLNENYKSAYNHYKLYVIYNDSLINEENTKQTVRAQMNYEFDKKEATAKLEQEKKDTIVKSEINRQRIIRNSFIGGFGLVLVLAIVVFNGYRNKQKANIVITQQKAEVELQKQIIEEKNTQITDSIVYAQEIQQSILPDKEKIKEALPDSFIFYQPKDILSGDFYFFYENEQSVYLAAADCTGHGVPGALMSMICSDKLKEAVQHTNNLSEVLSLVNKGIQKSLQQTGSKTANGDGMDIALVRLNKSNNKNELEYCGARSPLWIIRNGSSVIEEVRANNTTVGGSTDANFNFESHSININSGDSFYLFTDGYADQFGGENRKKMTVKKFKETLLGIQDKSMQEQGLSVSAFVEKWKGNQTQIDDILVIGVRI